ncbi:hypothetical protein CU097_011366 [Rhizopus azygosporus]|uniref:PH domain-containing protein n=1 Tax=Rhizopus azygosporus TaxID=86630 RepID=A0A367KGM0_RHIAZ|nr:hypothetical protein CU097_011366 [Rhizopus azygosporus]
MAKSIVPSVKNNVKRDPPTTVHLKGWLYKQKHGKSKAFHKRYFILYGEELRYYKNQNDTTALAIISLDHYTLIPDPLLPKQKQSKSLIFCLQSNDESKYDWPDYFLQADSEEEKQIWIDCLQKLATGSSTSVLDKWLQRLDMPMTTSKIYQESNNSVPTLSQKTKNSNNDDDDDYDEKSSIASSILLTPPNHFYSRSFLKSHKSCESLRAFKQMQESHSKRRPSDISCTKSDSSSKRLFPYKLFSWSSRSARSSSSITSMPSYDEYDDNTSLHEPSSSITITTTTTTTTTTTITAIPNHNDSHTHTQKALETHIIHPSEYNQDLETTKADICY